ncbi:MAG: CRISPR-associated protein Csx19 [Stenomitos frigidus ULC029]
MSQIAGKDRCQKVSTEVIADDAALKTWLLKQAPDYQLRYLLAHADDGVIWGYFSDSKLTIAREVFPQFPELRLSTLQQCRIFGVNGEVLLWTTEGGWRSRVISDPSTEAEHPDIIIEDQVLWGTQGKVQDNFTLLSDGQQELYHAVPLTNIQFDNPKALKRPVRLKVKHYIKYDDDGLARIWSSRLVDLFAEPKEK